MRPSQDAYMGATGSSQPEGKGFDRPVEPGSDELAKDWNLTGKELQFVARFRIENRPWVAWNLCYLRKHSRFPNQQADVPPTILVWLNRITGIPTHSVFRSPDRDSTRSKICNQVSSFLGFENFDDGVIADLREWASEKVCEGTSEFDLRSMVQPLLKEWRVIIPAQSTLERVFNSIWAEASEKVFDLIFQRLNTKTMKKIDAFLSVPDSSRYSILFSLKSPPHDPKAKAIKVWLEKNQCLTDIDPSSIDLSCISRRLASDLARHASQYDVSGLRRFRIEKRCALVACFLVECQSKILDQIVQMNDSFLTGFERSARNKFDESMLSANRKARKARSRLTRFVVRAIPLIRGQDWSSLVDMKGLEDIENDAKDLVELELLEKRGFLELIRRRSPNLMKYFSTFLHLQFEGERGTEELLKAIAMARSLESPGKKKLPEECPTGFLKGSWKQVFDVAKPEEKLRAWKVGLAFELRERLRSGDIYLPQSKRYRRFWEMVDQDANWKRRRLKVFEKLGIPEDFQAVKAALTREYYEALNAFRENISENPFVNLKNGRLALHKDPPLEVDPHVATLRSAIEQSMPQGLPIEKLLEIVDRHVDFTGILIEKSRNGYKWHGQKYVLRAAILSQATNIGITGMARAAKGMTSSILADAIRDCLGPNDLEAAIHGMVEFHSQLGFAKYYGSGETSSSDGQRFPVRSGSIETGYCTRYFGFYKKAISIYTHLADNYSVFSTQILSCGVREAIAVLDGLLSAEKSSLSPRMHTTDTHGYTDQMFALTYLLGVTFAPRIKDLGNAVLYRLSKQDNLTNLKGIFTGLVSLDEIGPHWDDMARVMSALRDGHIKAIDILPKLGAGYHLDGLSKAFNSFGKIIKTIFLLRYMTDAPFRRDIRIQLNKGEHRHALADHVFFANKGEFRQGDADSLISQASSLSLVCNAVLIWNTMEYDRIISQLKVTGLVVDEKCLCRISPLAFKHIALNGRYDFEEDQSEAQLL